MNYFELFEIPVQLSVDPLVLRSKFLELSRRYHPDHNAGDTEEKQVQVLDKAATLNKAYKTFQNQDETLRYVLQLKNLVEEEEKYTLPPDFLMEVMEINEAVMDSSDSASSLHEQINKLEEEIYTPVKNIIENYDDAKCTDADLLQVKDYYYKKKYIDRIRRELIEAR